MDTTNTDDTPYIWNFHQHYEAEAQDFLLHNVAACDIALSSKTKDSSSSEEVFCR
jgi:hypothetical protein